MSLGRISAPKPINLPSQKREHGGLDPNVELVPKGSHTWNQPGAEESALVHKPRIGEAPWSGGHPASMPPPSHHHHARSPDRSDSFPDLNGAGGGGPRSADNDARDPRYYRDEGPRYYRDDRGYDERYHHGHRDDRYHERESHEGGYDRRRRSFEHGHERD